MSRPTRPRSSPTISRRNTDLDFYYLRVNTEMYMLAEAIKQAKSTDPKAIALKLEGMK